MKCTFRLSYSNSKSYLSNPSLIFKIEVMEAALRLIKRVYFFDLQGIIMLTYSFHKFSNLVKMADFQNNFALLFVDFKKSKG